ncbi:hypothetical protein [endosymbiont of Lamellibrachia barhami]|uniref:hypothetical protein n=1 Tax=endosymbiont of Lamellibrachia barhami TaxID=205975 RepID=UPI001FE24CF5|nr:hypothetical protein [endosymbiont of Lamellibrachia barhami]
MLDEFSIAVDPVTTMRIEDVLKELKSEMTIILVTNLVQQARRSTWPIAPPFSWKASAWRSANRRPVHRKVERIRGPRIT